MAHDLDSTYSYENAMGYVGDLPWHGFGVKLPTDRPIGVDEAIKMVPAVDFATVMQPLAVATPTAPWEMFDGFKAITRSDTNAVLGVATDRYSPVQIRDQWASLDPLIDAGLARIETLGSIGGGKRVWGMVSLNRSRIPEWSALEKRVGEMAPYAMIIDDKTGKNSAVLAPTTVRVVCRNTMEASLAGLTNVIRIRHTGNTKAKLKAAGNEMWGGIIETYANLAGRYDLLASTRLTRKEYAGAVLDVLAPVPADPKRFASVARFEGARQRAEAKRDTLSNYWFNGAGHSANHSAWEALNGAIEVLDHNPDGTFRVPTTPEKHAASMLSGTVAALKRNVTKSLLNLVVARAQQGSTAGLSLVN